MTARRLLSVCAAAAVLALQGCTVAAIDPVVRILDPTIEEPTIAAIARWRAATGVDITITESKRDATVTVNWGISRSCKASQLGCTRVGRAFRKRITVAPDLEGRTDRLVEAVLLHELGHAMGAGHSSNPSDVLYPWTEPSDCLTERDIRKVCDVQACDRSVPEC